MAAVKKYAANSCERFSIIIMILLFFVDFQEFSVIFLVHCRLLVLGRSLREEI